MHIHLTKLLKNYVVKLLQMLQGAFIIDSENDFEALLAIHLLYQTSDLRIQNNFLYRLVKFELQLCSL